jgi:hypothetical protein
MPNTALKKTDRIIGRTLISAESLYQDVRERLVRELAEERQWMSYEELIELANSILNESEPIFVEHFEKADLAGWLAGFAWTADRLPSWLGTEIVIQTIGPPRKPPDGSLILPFGGDEEPIIRFPVIEKGAESLAERGILTRKQFDAASEAAKENAFTVAGEHTTETIATIRDTLAEVTQSGDSLEGFEELLAERIDTSAIGPAHLENVYRTNIQGAFRDGRETLASNPIVTEMFPYQEYLAIRDGRARENHLKLETLGLDNTSVYRRDDPFWDYFTPPWDYNCRCGVNLLTVEAAARRGVREAQEWLTTGKKPQSPEWRLKHIPFDPKAGFGSRGRVVAGAA